MLQPILEGKVGVGEKQPEERRHSRADRGGVDGELDFGKHSGAESALERKCLLM